MELDGRKVRVAEPYLEDRNCKNCGNVFSPNNGAHRYCRPSCRTSEWRRAYDIKQNLETHQTVIRRDGLTRVVQVGTENPQYRVMKHAGILFYTPNREEAIAYAKGTTDCNFLHNHVMEKLRYTASVTGKDKDELLAYLISDGLNRLKINHYKLPYNNLENEGRNQGV